MKKSLNGLSLFALAATAAAGLASSADAADVAIFHQFGAGNILTNMDVRVELLEESLS